jgi:hypothetical protein
MDSALEPGIYSYEEAKQMGIDTGPTREETGLPLCDPPDPDWPGLSADEDAPGACVADLREAEFGVGLEPGHSRATPS